MFKVLSKNVLIYGGANAFKSLVPLLMLPILTKYLTVNEFGILSLIETGILFLTPFILLNINSAINVEYFKLNRSELKKYITNSLLLSVIAFLCLSLIFFLSQNTFVVWFGFEKKIVVLLTLFAGLRVVSSVTLAILQVSGRAKDFAFFTLLQTLIEFFLSCLFIVLYQKGYLGRLEGVYIAFLISSILGFSILYRGDYIGKVNFIYSKNILKFGIPLIPHVLGGTIMAMSDRYFISYYFDNALVGLYTIAYQISAIMLLISMSINQAWTPLLFDLLQRKEFKKVLIFTIGLAFVFVVSGISIWFLRDILFDVFVNESYWGAKKYFLYLLAGFVFQSLYFLVTNLLFFEKKTSLLAALTIFGASINIFLNYYFIVEYGVIGVAYATSITWFVFFIFVLFFNHQTFIKRRGCVEVD